MAGLFMPQKKQSWSSEASWPQKAQVLGKPRSTATNYPRLFPFRLVRLLKRNRSINVDDAGLKCESSVVSSSLSVLVCGVAGFRGWSSRLKTWVPQLARKLPCCFSSVVPCALKNT
ncbi:hypothetical protein MTO96_025590 [Rhipicephalus appendiculatus]